MAKKKYTNNTYTSGGDKCSKEVEGWQGKGTEDVLSKKVQNIFSGKVTLKEKYKLSMGVSIEEENPK